MVPSPEAHHDVQALAAFRSNVHSRAAKRGMAARAAIRFSRATQAAAMAGWRQHAAHRAAMSRTAQKALGALRHRLAAAALRSWREHAADLVERRQQARTENVNCRMIRWPMVLRSQTVPATSGRWYSCLFCKA